MIDKTLTLIGFTAAVDSVNQVWTHSSAGRLLERLALHYKHVCWCANVVSSEKTKQYSFRIPVNVTLIPTPGYSSTLDAMFILRKIQNSYEKAILCGDHVLIRGLVPGTSAIYKICRKHEKRPLHWIVGNSYKLMQQGRRENYVKDFASLIYAWRWFQVVKKGIKNTSGAALCNGKEIYDLMKDVKRYETVSSTITEEDFLYREDTCQNDTIRIVTTSFIRPEKGLEYLIDAIPKVRTKKKLMLCCIGAFEKGKGYKELLYSKIKANKLTDRVEFLGYCNPEDFMPFYQSCDIFVLASLSEGTPRCIIESRAAGLPTIATNVGGIPSSVSNGVDGILVSPKNSSAIASAIEALIENNELRRSIIQKGYETAKRLSLPNSVHDIITAFTSINEK